MILGGYAAILGYIFLLIFGIGPLVQKFSDLETSRKVIHTMLFVVWILLTAFFRDTVHQIIIPVLFIILNLLSYRFHIYASVEREEDNHFGTVYFAIVVTAVMTFVYFFPEYYAYSGIAIFCLTFGDGFAAMIGYHVRSKSLMPHKSLAGFLSCGAASFLSVLAFCLVYSVPFSLLQILVIGVLAAILELCEAGMDNFSVTIGVFLVCLGFHHAADATFLVGLILGIAVFLPVFLSRAIDLYGSLLALGMVVSFYCLGGVFALTVLLLAYGTIAVISRIRKKRLGKKEHGRGFLQILINGGFSTLAMVAYGLIGHKGLLIVSLVAVGGCFVDSVSSDVGTLSRKAPHDILRRKPVPAGLSGGISLLGTVCALVASAAIAAATVWQLALNWTDGLIMTALIFGQSVLDSLLGSGLQVKYRCAVCGELTEEKTHCDLAALRHSGLSWMDNNMVNFLSSLAVTLAALAIFWR